jgi:hypothetical protein
MHIIRFFVTGNFAVHEDPEPIEVGSLGLCSHGD